jgi:hypothetical protein
MEVGVNDEELEKLRRQARAALTAIRKTFDNWLIVGRYVETGQQWAMQMSTRTCPKAFATTLHGKSG